MAIFESRNSVIVFDLDDTLYPEKSYVLSGISAVSQCIDELFGKRVESRLLEYCQAGGDDFIGEACRLAELPPQAKQSLLWIYRLHHPRISLDPDVAALIEDLRRAEFPLAILTDGRSVTQRLKIKALGLESLPVYISEEYGSEKPDPLRFEQVMRDLPAKQYAYIADNPKKDFKAPLSLGWTTFQVQWQPYFVHKPGETVEYQPLNHFHIANLSDFRKFVADI